MASEKESLPCRIWLCWSITPKSALYVSCSFVCGTVTGRVTVDPLLRYTRWVFTYGLPSALLTPPVAKRKIGCSSPTLKTAAILMVLPRALHKKKQKKTF